MKKKKIEGKDKQVEIKSSAIEIGSVKIRIVGNTHLIMKKLSEKVIEKLTETQTGSGKVKRGSRPPVEQEVENCIHRNSQGEVCFPSSAFELGMQYVAPQLENVTVKDAKSIRVNGVDGSDKVKINHERMIVRKDGVKVGGRGPGTGTLTYVHRPQFENWSTTLIVSYNKQLVSLEQIVALLNLAGFHAGIGENRPNSPMKPGPHGMYKVKLG